MKLIPISFDGHRELFSRPCLGGVPFPVAVGSGKLFCQFHKFPLYIQLLLYYLDLNIVLSVFIFIGMRQKLCEITAWDSSVA